MKRENVKRQNLWREKQFTFRASRLTRGGQGVIPFLSREEGQGLIEYALIIVLVAIVVIAIGLLLGDLIEDFLNQLPEALIDFFNRIIQSIF